VQEVYITLAQYAEELRPQVKSTTFTVQPAWRQEYFRRLVAAKVPVDSATYFAAPGYFDRLLSNRVAKVAFGDSTVAKRQFAEDPQVQKALELLHKGGTQRDLFSMVGAATPSAKGRP
jgi:carboxyl-terminal processing protease